MVEQQLRTDGKGNKYTGAPVGYKHQWKYTEPEVEETKLSQTLWAFRMKSTKRKVTESRTNGNIEPGTMYHWYFIGDQIVRKIDENSYETDLQAIKYKLGHKRPYWKTFSYNYQDQIKTGKSQTQMKIQALNEELNMLKQIQEREPTQEERLKWANKQE